MGDTRPVHYRAYGKVSPCLVAQMPLHLTTPRTEAPHG